MHIVLVHVQVKPECISAFLQATLANARNSVQEPGIARFDVIQESGDPAQFTLIEVYRTPEDPARHKETDHYKRWRDAVEPMMAAPRKGVRYVNAFPDDAGWG